MSTVRMPQIRIPRALRTTRRRLVAVPETEYRRLLTIARLRDEEVADVRASEEEYRQGRYVTAKNIDEAMKKARTRGWLD